MVWNPEKVKRLRERLGLTQEELAAKVGAHRVTIARIETGTRRPSVDLLPRLAKALKVTTDELLR